MHKKIKVFNHGEMQRDFTYIDDIVEGVIRVLSMPSKDNIPHRVLNIGNNKPIKLEYFIQVIENACGKKAVKNLWICSQEMFQLLMQTLKL